MSKKEVNFSTDSIRPANGYGPILRPTARETYSLRQQIVDRAILPLALTSSNIC